MPRKTKKQKKLAQTRTSQLPSREQVRVSIPTAELSTPQSIKKEQLPLVAKQHIVHKTDHTDHESATFFRHDIQKTALLTSVIVIIEVVLYQLMQNGMLEKWIPMLKI